MSVVGLHPEELFDKLLDGEITPGEHERLRQHLNECDVCRFEWAARGDFQEEALKLAVAPPPLLPLRPPAPVAGVGRSRRRRSRIVIWGLAAAALITASGAVAAVATGVVAKPSWRALSVVFSPGPSQPAEAKAPAARVGCKGADCAQAAAAPAALPKVAPVAAAAPERHEPAEAARVFAPPRGRDSGRVARVERARAPEASLSTPTTTSASPETVKEPLTSAKLFADANQARRAGDIGRASGLYRLLQDQFPGSPEAELSRVTMALLLLDSGDAQSALAGFERYLAGSSRGLEAEALVGRARALGRLGRRDLEVFAWQEVRRKYPRTIYGRQATERLSSLGQP